MLTILIIIVNIAVITVLWVFYHDNVEIQSDTIPTYIVVIGFMLWVLNLLYIAL